MLKDSVVHPSLHALTNMPVLCVHEMPEINRIAPVKIRARHFCRVKKEVALDARVPGTLWPQIKCGNMIHGQAQHQVRIKELSFVAFLFGLAKSREGRTIGDAIGRKGIGSLALGNAFIPVQPDATLAKFRHDMT